MAHVRSFDYSFVFCLLVEIPLLQHSEQNLAGKPCTYVLSLLIRDQQRFVQRRERTVSFMIPYQG